ncbi:MAG: alpha/beta hydrolase [Solirubrobacteraceae bacterium]|jgi:pimeloyl-ACP methyl ester carboxylesterase
MNPTVEHRIETPDGRVLAALEGGDPAGRPVLSFHGTPGSRLLFAPDAALCARDGIRLISYDRPGYGESTASPGRSVADCVKDVRAIAAALEIDQLAVWGISGGGPHALACAALLPDLVVAVAALAPLAPFGAPDLDFFAGMGEQNVEDIKLELADPAAARAKGEREREDYLAADVATLAGLMHTLLGPADQAAFSGELGEYLVESVRWGLAPSADGWWDDGVALIEPWGFEVDSIATPVRLHHGRDDRFVPFGHGEWFARHIPGVEAVLTDEDGHLTLLRHHLEAIHAWLLGHFA